MENLDPFRPLKTPTSKRPLLGMTVLVVEDSRFASESMRLMCLRSGARIRRADSLKAARRHLQVYRPSVVIVDLGLPDGSGVDLIEELDRATPRVGVLLAISGDEATRDLAIQTGADSFLSKPLESLGVFQQSILTHLPPDRRPSQPALVNTDVIEPDPVAYQDDMTHIANLLDDHQDGPVVDYIAQFLCSVAKAANDEQLEKAATDLIAARTHGRISGAKLALLAGLVQERLSERIAI